jgi:glutamate mutase epsilon subunit
MFNRNELLTARDCDGAIRFINPERMPFDESIRDFHLGQIDRRKTRERLHRDSQLMARDLTRIGKNDFAFWPLDGVYIT